LKSEIEAQIINIAKKKLEAMEKGDFDGARKYKLETEKMQEERILIEAELTRLLDEQKTQEQANNNNTPTPTESQVSFTCSFIILYKNFIHHLHSVQSV
jgi:hypothetical protein